MVVPLPKKIWFIILLFSLFLLVVFVIFPYIPVKYLLVVNPKTGAIPWGIPLGHSRGVLFTNWWVFLSSYAIKDPPLFYLSISIISLFVFFIIAFIPNDFFHRLFSKKCLQKTLPLWLAIASFLLFFYFKINPIEKFNFGDGDLYPKQIDRGIVNEASILNDYIFIGIRILLDLFLGGKNGELAIQVATSLFGSFFVFFVVIYVRTICKNYFEKIILFLGIVTSSSLLMFFGYIETTALSLTLMSLFFTSSLKYLECRSEKKWFYISLLSIPLLILSHAGGILLTIAVPLILTEAHRGSWKKSLPRILCIKNIAYFVSLLLLPLFSIFLVRHFQHIVRNDFLGNINPFVPFTDENTGLLRRGRPFYSMFSVNHFSDIFSVILLVSPFGLLITSIVCFIRKRYRSTDLTKHARFLWILGSSAICAGFIPLLWHFDFTTYGDWNISATYLFPLNILAWTSFLLAIRIFKRTNIINIIVTVMIGIQILLFYSFYLNLGNSFNLLLLEKCGSQCS